MGFRSWRAVHFWCLFSVGTSFRIEKLQERKTNINLALPDKARAPVWWSSSPASRAIQRAGKGLEAQLSEAALRALCANFEAGGAEAIDDVTEAGFCKALLTC